MVGEKLRELLEMRGMSQSELARRCGTSKTTINSIIIRNNKGMDLSLMQKIAEILDVPLEYFYDRKDEQNDEQSSEDADDQEMRELLEALRRDPERQTMFRRLKNASISDIRKAVAILDALEGVGGDDE